MKKVHLWGISLKSFEEGSENYYAVFEYNMALCRKAAILQFIGDDRLRAFRKQTKEFYIQMHSNFDVEILKSMTEDYSDVKSLVWLCSFLSSFKGNENLMSNVKEAYTNTDVQSLLMNDKYILEFYQVS